MWNENQWNTLGAISNAIIPALSLDELNRASPESPADDKSLIASVECADLPGYRPLIESLMRGVPPAKSQLLGMVLMALSYRASAVLLTRSPKLLTEMSVQERGAVIKSWQSSPLKALNQLAAQLVDATMLGFVYSSPTALRSFGYKLDNPVFDRICLTPLYVPKFIESFNDVFDIVVIGSGCGGGVVAYEASRAGYRVLVVEKGKYYAPSEISQNPREVEEQCFEMSGCFMSEDGSTNIAAGATVGGGGAVNWSCSLRTPQAIREEWAHEVPWYKSTVYDDALDYVCGAMGVTTDFGAAHSFTNNLILESCAKLDYPSKLAPQNTGKHVYNNRFHGFGHRTGENGGIAVWLDGATQNGAVMAANALARRIHHHNGRATGVELDVNGSSVFIKAKRIVSSSGSLHTPGLLMRSGFRNKHIGKHLKLHPSTLVFGDYDEVVNRNDDPIMTVISTVVDDLDGAHHGPKIEAVHHMPHIVGKFLPFVDGKQFATDLARYAHLSALLVITRDKTEGNIFVDKQVPLNLSVNYTTNKYDLWALHQGCIVAANMQYVGGAKRIIFPDPMVPEFHSSRPKDKRRLNDSDYQDWLTVATNAKFYNYSVGVGSAHQMGSCRMSARGPRYGAVDAKGRLYECRNVHVIDTSVFPSASGVNPMISVLSTAKVLADELVHALRMEASKL